jgi:RimJ/RimL family protein N-acetyltransferase
MQVRRLTKEDAKEFWDLRLLALESEPVGFGESTAEHHAVGVAGTAERLSAGDGESFILGAFDGERLVGTAGFYREQKAKRRQTGWIWGVFVHPSHRRKGTGFALISALIDEARALPGLITLHLTVAVTQSAARQMYAGLGFRVFGTVPRALYVKGQYFDEEMMSLDLRGQPHEH